RRNNGSSRAATPPGPGHSQPPGGKDRVSPCHRPSRGGGGGRPSQPPQGVLSVEKRQEEKVRFHIEKLEERIAPAIVPVNGGGNPPNGEATGVPRENPPGPAPPGHN